MEAAATIRITKPTHRRLRRLSKTLREPHDKVIARGLDAIERELFWEGWDEEAAAYLERYGKLESEERESFSGTVADGG
jgi:predicted transcriptional regulator